MEQNVNNVDQALLSPAPIPRGVHTMKYGLHDCHYSDDDIDVGGSVMARGIEPKYRSKKKKDGDKKGQSLQWLFKVATIVYPESKMPQVLRDNLRLNAGSFLCNRSNGGNCWRSH
jgi:hypothetical protein